MENREYDFVFAECHIAMEWGLLLYALNFFSLEDVHANSSLYYIFRFDLYMPFSIAIECSGSTKSRRDSKGRYPS